MLYVKFIFLGILISLSIYHFFVWLGRRNDISNLSYVIYCLIFSLIIFNGQIYEHLTFYNQKIGTFLLIVTGVLCPISIIFFTYSTLDLKEVKKIFLLSVIILLLSGFILGLLVLINPKMIYYEIVSFIDIVIGTILLIIVIWKFIKHKQYKNKKKLLILLGILISGISFMLINLIYSIIDINQDINFIIFFSPFLFQILFIAYVLAADFNREHKDLIKLTNTLEQKVIERTKQLEDKTSQLEQANQQIKEASEQKTMAFINIFHEIKNPLTIISNYLNKYINTKGATDDLIIVKRNIDKLKVDSNNLLDFEKLDREMQFYDHSMIINLTDLAKMNILLFKELANRKGIKLDFNIEENIYTRADYKAIDRIFINLMDNAIKFTDIDGNINVNLSTDNKQIKLVISDTGIGISKRNLGHIFEPYYQIYHQKSNRQGIGMGLSLVKKILDKLNANIYVKSNLEKGTSFIITFKSYLLNKGDVTQDIIKDKDSIIDIINIKLKEEKYKPERYNLLIVEDNIEMISFLQYSLYDKYNLYYAKNGKVAFEKLNTMTVKPNVIISDIMMDEMDGIELFSKLSDSKFKNIPFVFLTAKTMFEEKIKTIKSGAIHYIYKPFIIEELTAKVESIIKLQESQEEVQILDKEDSLKKLYEKYKISKRGMEILKLLYKGLEYRQIADRLGISVNTIGTHTKILFKKCNVINKSELLRIFQSYLE